MPSRPDTDERCAKNDEDFLFEHLGGEHTISEFSCLIFLRRRIRETSRGLRRRYTRDFGRATPGRVRTVGRRNGDGAKSSAARFRVRFGRRPSRRPTPNLSRPSAINPRN